MPMFKRGNDAPPLPPPSPGRFRKASSELFFYGRITREETEKILRMKGCEDGLFLLRESISPLGNYTISICHSKSVHHYAVEKETDGKYGIKDGPKFTCPLVLLDHYKSHADGLITKPKTPCNREPNQHAVAFRGMTYNDLEKEMNVRANSIRHVDIERVFGAMRDHFTKMVARDLHLKQPWFHKKTSREQAEKRLMENGMRQGNFLMRVRDDKKTFALSMVVGGGFKHYLIDVTSENKYYIDDGPKFECLIMLVDHYHNKQDGLACKLTGPCKNPSCSEEELQRYLRTCNEHLFVNANGSARRDSPPSHRAPFRPDPRRESMAVPPIPSSSSRSDTFLDTEDPPESNEPAPKIDGNVPDIEIYMDLRRKEKNFELEPNRLTLQEKLGSGQFGSVVKGMCRMGSEQIPVAIKTLKNEEILPGVEPELFKEAKLMQELDHKNIVRMIGICKADSIMLVLELAPLGPLNKFLSKNKEMKEVDIIKLMLQVANGMVFLEGKKYVHRDLAARNVLLVNKRFAKISDFGMSKALARESNYYEANAPGKWPLKWYAIECILYFKFDSKSDVWSYGVTMWEALTYGGKPYHKMKSQEIVDFLLAGKRLQRPDACCQKAYKIMQSCWLQNKEDRPNFPELAHRMELLHQDMLVSSM